MPHSPCVSILTATHNGERFLAKTIESILGQTLTDFEYILIDDASTDGSAQIIEHYATQNARIIPIRNSSNLGPGAALNQGLGIARGRYIANLDHDDLAMPQRLERQVLFLDAEPTIGVVGTFARLIDEQGLPVEQSISTYDYPTEPAVVRWAMCYCCALLHSSVLMRSALVKQAGGYSAHHRYICDYELFSRLLSLTEFANLPEYLTAYRLGPHQTSSAHAPTQRMQVILLLYAMHRERLGIDVSISEVANLYGIHWGHQLEELDAVSQAADLLQRLFIKHCQTLGANNEERGVQQDCAFRLLSLGWHNHHLSRQTAARIFMQAVRLDLAALCRPSSWRRIRRQRKQRLS